MKLVEDRSEPEQLDALKVDLPQLRLCWEDGLKPTEAFEYTTEKSEMRPRDWMKRRNEKMQADNLASCGGVPCRMFTEKMNAEESRFTLGFCVVMAFLTGVGVGALLIHWIK